MVLHTVAAKPRPASPVCKPGPAARQWVLAFLSTCIMGPALAQDDTARPWVLRHVEETTGTRIYVRERSGHAPAFRAEGRLRTTPGALVAVLMDREHMPEWVFRTRQVQVLERDGPWRGVSRVITAMPPPLLDREAIVAWQMSQDPGSGTVTIEGRSDSTRLPPTEGLVRMPEFATRWVFTPRADGEIDVRFEGHADLGGNLALWPLSAFVAAAVWQAPLYTLDALRGMVVRAPYAGTRMPASEARPR